MNFKKFFYQQYYFSLLLCCLFCVVFSGCDFVYRLIQKEGAEEKEIIGELLPMEPNAKVKEVQTLLKIYGYSVGNPDGTLGNNTRLALAAFQEDSQLKVTRFIDYQTWGKLSFHEDIGLIKDGKLNIIMMQKALKAAGYDPGKIDGHDGQKTQDALKAFQSAQGLKADGRAGLKTLNKLAQYLE